ncbi:hypothetical protein SEA_CELAENA_1 [Microbacterium phage Celaena]|uniref:hypothetical protein n=1 Tax=Microbacterium phage Celaena TaxID=2591214 RepID=UPI001163EC3B|nr:hypothetical protein QDW17_gp01 [Microbacterium phage Celaena]QDH92380.1 hypothetical protein SEA_CELAENA_1 [Microbacterium phage Celaena]
MDEWIGCDGPKCPARALVHVAKFEENEKQVHYCGHHADEYMAKLRVWGIVTDDRLSGKVVAKIEAPKAAFA